MCQMCIRGQLLGPVPFANNKVYASKGGYHRHLREKHKIGRNGEKLTEAKIKELREAEKNGDDASEGDAD